ncbi:TPA: type IV secretion system DNA-binding domain-containing protein, partial [Escherichia coli]|nr:type IV secretion system DNA-binding domain-containing protein [Escherichia coli]
MSLTKSLLFTLLLSAAAVQASTRDEIERLWNPQGMATQPAQPAAGTSARTAKPAPRWFRLSNGRQVNLADWKVVLFMQGHCPYCHQFDPVLKQLAQQYGFSVFSYIRIGDLPIIRDSEIQNFCLHGTVGAGKSEVIRRLANYARQRGDMVVIYDRSGEFVKSYYDPSIDKILNPLDARCAAWDLWKECLTQPDFDNTANTLIPMGTKEDPFWQGSGRTIFAEAAYLMRNDPNRSYSKLVDTLLSIKIEKLRTFLRNSPAANLVEEKIEKTAISIRAVLTNYVKAIRYLQGIEHNGEPFTIRDWMRGVRED